MGTPSWLYYLSGVVMLAVAAYCALLLVGSAPTRAFRGRDVDLGHVFMGVAMAGMFVPSWAFGPGWFWELVFGALMVWYVVKGAQSIQRFGVHVTHWAIHAVMSFTMLLMYWFPMNATTGRAVGMSMGGGSSHAMLQPGLGFALTLVLLGSAVFTLGSPTKGVSHHGSHVPARLLVTAGGGAVEEAPPAPAAPTGPFGVLASPRLEDLSHVVMCVGMAFMLVLML